MIIFVDGFSSEILGAPLFYSTTLNIYRSHSTETSPKPVVVLNLQEKKSRNMLKKKLAETKGFGFQERKGILEP